MSLQAHGRADPGGSAPSLRTAQHLRLAVAALLAVLPARLDAQDTSAIQLRWAIAPALPLRMQTTGAMRLGPGQPVFLEEHLVQLHRAPALPTDSGKGRFDVFVERDRYGAATDSEAATRVLRDINPGTRGRLILAPNGSWEADVDRPTDTYASAALAEQMLGVLPVVLPGRPVSPGETWSVHLFQTRTNPRLGTLWVAIDGGAALDSVTRVAPDSILAWISVTAQITEIAGKDTSRRALTSQLVWDVRRGAPVTATTKTSGSYLAMPNEFAKEPRTYPMHTEQHLRLLSSESNESSP